MCLWHWHYHQECERERHDTVTGKHHFHLHCTVAVSVGVIEARCGRQISPCVLTYVRRPRWLWKCSTPPLWHTRESPWHPVVRILGISMGRSDTTAFSVHSLYLHETRRAARCGMCCNWVLCSNVRIPTLLLCCNLSSSMWGVSCYMLRGGRCRCCHCIAAYAPGAVVGDGVAAGAVVQAGVALGTTHPGEGVVLHDRSHLRLIQLHEAVGVE